MQRKGNIPADGRDAGGDEETQLKHRVSEVGEQFGHVAGCFRITKKQMLPCSGICFLPAFASGRLSVVGLLLLQSSGMAHYAPFKPFTPFFQTLKKPGCCIIPASFVT
jgi:hypothetical protein